MKPISSVARKRHMEPPAGAADARRSGFDLTESSGKGPVPTLRLALGFCDDIGRYLRNEAVLAVPPSVAYRARNRAALATACAFALVLITAALVSIRQSIRANREAGVAQAVNDFLQNDLLGQASAYNQSKPDPDITWLWCPSRIMLRLLPKRKGYNISQTLALGGS